MNILIVSQYFHPERFVISGLAEDLSNAGHCVTVLTGMPNYPTGKLFPGYIRFWPKRERYHNIEVIRVPIIPRGRASSLRLLINYLSYAVSASLFARFLIRGPVDAILVYEPSPITVGIPAIVAKWIKGAPILFWVQDLWPESLIATGAVRSRLLLRLVAGLVRWIYRRCDMILVQAQAFVPKIRQFAPIGSTIRYFPNPADRCYRPLWPAEDAPERLLMRPGFRVVFAGNMGVAQDLGNVLSAAERLKHHKDIQWILIGDGRIRPWVEEQIQLRKLQQNVQLLGPFEPERMPIFFALSDVLLVTLRREEIFSLTIPSKLQAYLACGRPIIAAIEGEGARVVEAAKAGLVCAPGDPASLAVAVETFHAMAEPDRAAMGASGRRYYDAEFDRNLLLERLESCLQEARRSYE